MTKTQELKMQAMAAAQLVQDRIKQKQAESAISQLSKIKAILDSAAAPANSKVTRGSSPFGTFIPLVRNK